MVALARGVAPVDDWPFAAQAGGAFAAVLAALGTLGAGLAWLLNFHSERSDGKSARLQAWESSLVAREKGYREGLEADFGELKGEVIKLRGDIGALGQSLLEVTLELRQLDPQSAALARATAVLQRAFPPSFAVPVDMRDMAQRLDGGEHG